MCRSGEVKRNGKSRHGKQRFKCLCCSRTFGWTNRITRDRRRRIWFDRWVMEGYSFRQLSTQSGKGTATLKRLVDRALLVAPPLIAVREARHILFDGTYIYRRTIGVMAVMNGELHELIAGAYGLKESFPHLVPFLAEVRTRGCMPKSATVDGNPHAIAALKTVWPEIIIQRCLVHVQRQGLMWCRAKPKRTSAKHLRKLFLQVTGIRTMKDRDHFLAKLASWEARYGAHIGTSRETGWVASDLKRARSMLMHALPDMFHYLDDPMIPWNTNSLEGYFSRLKHRYRQHRGLAHHHRRPYFNWYFYLCRR